jgi:hypothetical protein
VLVTFLVLSAWPFKGGRYLYFINRFLEDFLLEFYTYLNHLLNRGLVGLRLARKA